MLDYQLSQCRGCDEALGIETLRAFVDSQNLSATAEWIRACFLNAFWTPPRPLTTKSAQGTFDELSDLMTGGFVFDNGHARLSYRRARVDDLEQWEGILTRNGPHGDALWTAHLPVMSQVVVPFVVADTFLFVGGPDNALYVGDLGSGKILARLLPAEEPDGFDNPNSLYRPPFCRDGLIYLEAGGKVASTSRLKPKDPRYGPFAFVEYPRVYIVKLRAGRTAGR
ncbi:MAG: hypothetical protein WBS54_06960 [Acidobacteriota bacterium]